MEKLQIVKPVIYFRPPFNIK